MAIAGGCRCGAVRYGLSLDRPPPAYACHCLHCQTWSGSAFGLHAILPQDVLAIDGPVVSFQVEGSASRQRACGRCHARLYNDNPAIPGMIVLRLGTLDASDRIEPIAHIWTKRKQPWVALPEDVAQFPENPTPEAFAAAAATG